jgi:hypothetical protein
MVMERSIGNREGNGVTGCSRAGRGNNDRGGCTGEVKEAAKQIVQDITVLMDPDANGGVISSVLEFLLIFNMQSSISHIYAPITIRQDLGKLYFKHENQDKQQV